eukprot:6177200-Pleurochrysis_carterae.AAC.1
MARAKALLRAAGTARGSRLQQLCGSRPCWLQRAPAPRPGWSRARCCSIGARLQQRIHARARQRTSALRWTFFERESAAGHVLTVFARA